MSDRFKFRLKVPTGELVYITGFVIDQNKSKIRIFRMNQDMPDGMGTALYMLSEVSEIEQCTGLKDKNGRLIYEGDVVKSGRDMGVVKYGNPKDMMINCGEYSVDYCGYYLDISDPNIEARCYFQYWEVIGNIHENGDLLK